MFLKLTDNETQTEVYLNPNHIIRFIPNAAGEGTLIWMSDDAHVAAVGDPQIVSVHEPAEEVFRIISRAEKTGGRPGGGSRGLI